MSPPRKSFSFYMLIKAYCQDKQHYERPYDIEGCPSSPNVEGNYRRKPKIKIENTPPARRT
jgi:hypothetical protein